MKTRMPGMEIERTLQGWYDDDNGGRQPESRDEIRRLMRQAHALVSRLAPYGANVQTYEDGLVLQELGVRLVEAGIEICRVRVQQSYSRQKKDAAGSQEGER